MNPQLEELKQEIPYNNDTDLGDFLSRKGVEEYINRTWNLAMERAKFIVEQNLGIGGDYDGSEKQKKNTILAKSIVTAINKEKV